MCCANLFSIYILLLYTFFVHHSNNCHLWFPHHSIFFFFQFRMHFDFNSVRVLWNGQFRFDSEFQHFHFMSEYQLYDRSVDNKLQLTLLNELILTVSTVLRYSHWNCEFGIDIIDYNLNNDLQNIDWHFRSFLRLDWKVELRLH